MRFLTRLILGACCALIILGLIRRFMTRKSEHHQDRSTVYSPEAVEVQRIKSDVPEPHPLVTETTPDEPLPERSTEVHNEPEITPNVDESSPPSSDGTILGEPSPELSEVTPEVGNIAPEESESDSNVDESPPPRSTDAVLSDDSQSDSDQDRSVVLPPSKSGSTTPSRHVQPTPGREEAVEPPAHPGHKVKTGVYYPPTSPRLPTASLRCREGADGWELYIDLPEDREVSEIKQNETLLSHNGEVVLSDFTGSVQIVYGDGRTQSILLAAPLYFRTDQDWSEPGRLAVQISDTGSFVVIAPVDMDGEFRDSIHAPEECADPNFRAHFVDMGERDGDEVAPGAYPMRLTGKTLNDDADKNFHGEIFVGSPPDLEVSRRIGRARVVRETGDIKKNDWGKNFNPHNQTLASVLGDRDGWFSVRTYLIGSSREYESRPFRYFRSLERITLGGELHAADMILVPDRNRSYQTLRLRFCCGDDSSLIPKVVEPADQRVHIWGEEISVPPRPDVQTVSCLFENQATIEVRVPRVWWKFSDDKLEYTNQVREIWLYDFVRLASDSESFEIRLPQGVGTAHIGFDDKLEHRSSPVEGVVRVDFLDLVDDIALETIEVGQEVSLYIQIENEKVELMRIHRKLESVSG